MVEVVVPAGKRVMDWALPLVVDARMAGAWVTDYFFEFVVRVKTREQLDVLWLARYDLVEAFAGHTMTWTWDVDDDAKLSIEISSEPTDGSQS